MATTKEPTREETYDARVRQPMSEDEKKAAFMAACSHVATTLTALDEAGRRDRFAQLATPFVETGGLDMWALGAAVICMYCPPEANKTMMIKAALDAALQVGARRPLNPRE